MPPIGVFKGKAAEFGRSADSPPGQEETMKTIFVKVAAGAIVSVLAGGAAVAQSVEEVNVVANRAVTAKAAGRTSSGVPIVDLTLSYPVSVEGLDLASNKGAEELARRVSRAARAACKEIGRQYPSAAPPDAECARAAERDGMAKAREMVAAAQSAALRK
jgi:UrcA family protein